MPEVITVANRKGGSGKTTTAVNLAVEWAIRGARTLLVDLDTQGHAGVAVGFVGRPSPARTVHALFLPRPKGAALCVEGRPTRIDRLSLLPADPFFDATRGGRDPTVLRRALRGPAFAAYDRIVIDAPPTRDIVLAAGLVAAHAVVVPFLPHPLSLVSLRQFVRLFHGLATGCEHDIRTLLLLPVMHDPRVRLHRAVMAEVAGWFGPSRLLRGVHASVRLAEAFGEGLPIQRHAPRSRSAAEFQVLADEIDQALGLGPGPAPSSRNVQDPEDD